MELQLSSERKAQLREYASRHGQDPTEALDEVLSSALESDRLDFIEAVHAIRRGYEEAEMQGTQSADEMFEDLRLKHGLSS